jgi:aminoglycoside N3'-acetyltransferase
MSARTESLSTSLTQKDIEVGLRQLGLGQGDAVEVHSSLSSFGWVEGGAPPVVDVLMNVVGENGALVMSAYPVSLPLPLTEQEKARGILAKVRIFGEDYVGRTGMGAIADEFCRRPGTVLGTGIHRVCAWGRDAELHRRGYPHLLDIDGWVLLLGVDIHRCSSMHVAESKVGVPAMISRHFEVPEDIRRDYPDDVWYIQYGSTPDDAWGRVQDEAERRGLVKRHRIGRAECMLFKARAVVGIYEEALRKNPFGLFGVEKTEPTNRA